LNLACLGSGNFLPLVSLRRVLRCVKKTTQSLSVAQAQRQTNRLGSFDMLRHYQALDEMTTEVESK